MEIRADEITKIIREQLAGFTADVDVAEVGTVLSAWATASPASTASSAAWPASCSSCPTASWAWR